MAYYLDTWARDRKTGQTTLRQKIKLAFMEEDPTLIGSLEPTSLARGCDWSHWQGDVDVLKWKNEGDVAAGMPKSSDGKQVVSGDPTYPPNYVDDWFYRNVQKLYDARMACLPFHYVQPYFPDYTVLGTVDWNWKVIKQAMDPLTPKVSYHGYVLDFEEKNTTNPNGSDVVLALRDRCLNDTKLSKVPVIIYTSMNILNYYTNLMNQISFDGYDKSLLWLAQWPYNTVTNTTWANMIASILAKLSMKVITPGFVDWWCLQWTSSMILPGCSGRLDQNVFKMTKAQLYNQLGFDPGTTTPPPPSNYVTQEQLLATNTRVAAVEALAHPKSHTHPIGDAV